MVFFHSKIADKLYINPFYTNRFDRRVKKENTMKIIRSE